MRSKTNRNEAPERYEHGEIDDILVENKEGKIITQSDIQRTIDIYINGLRDPESIYNNKPMLFMGLLEAIYRRNIKYILPDSYNNDYELLDSIFINIYINLCYSFGYIPSCSTFLIHLVHVSTINLFSIKTGFYRDNSKVNNNTYSILKKWESLSNSDLFNNVAHTGSIGGMFVLKVKGFSDQPQQQPQIQVNITPAIDEKQLAALTGGAAPIAPPLPSEN